MPSSAEELKASLEAHNAAFEALLRLIPAKYYLAPEDDGEYVSKYQKNSKKQKAPKQAIKEASKKAKRDKLDPANNKSIVEIQEEAALKKDAAASKKKGKARQQQQDEDDDDESSSEGENIDLGVDTMKVDDGDEEVSAGDEDEGENGKDGAEVEYRPMEAPASVEMLRAKLRARVEELQKKNGRSGSGGDAGSKDELLEERRMQRAAMRERRRKETREKKRKEEEEKRKKGKGKEKQQVGTNAPTVKSQLLVPDVSGHPSTGGSSQYTNVAFSTLAGSTPSVSKSLKTSSNPTQALAQLSKRAEARAALPAEKRKELEERDAWAKASARVSGAKVHDDPARLQKAAKRREKEKVKSKKAWEERKEELAKAQATRAKKRADNIAMRHEKRKGGTAGKKDGKRRPGFEGKSFSSGTSKKVKAKLSGKGKGTK